jgi:hypothetical protein
LLDEVGRAMRRVRAAPRMGSIWNLVDHPSTIESGGRGEIPLCGPVAQRSEQRTHNPSVAGSNPARPIGKPPHLVRFQRRAGVSVGVSAAPVSAWNFPTASPRELGRQAEAFAGGCHTAAVGVASAGWKWCHARTVTYEELGPFLQAVGVAQAADETIDVAGLCRELELAEGALHERLRILEGWGLILAGLQEGLPPILRDAGREYLALQGSVDPAVLGFLPFVIDDLHARRALLDAGTIVVDEFRAAVLDGRAVAHAQDLVPEAFAPAITERIAIDLFAASVALMAPPLGQRAGRVRRRRGSCSGGDGGGRRVASVEGRPGRPHARRLSGSKR